MMDWICVRKTRKCLKNNSEGYHESGLFKVVAFDLLGKLWINLHFSIESRKVRSSVCKWLKECISNELTHLVILLEWKWIRQFGPSPKFLQFQAVPRDSDMTNSGTTFGDRSLERILHAEKGRAQGNRGERIKRRTRGN